MAKNIYFYGRYSDEPQGEGSSYQRQFDKAKAYCPTLIEDREHCFFDKGKSGYTGANLEEGSDLKRFHDLVASRVIPAGSILLVEALDRLSRQDMWTAVDNLRALLKQGVVVKTLLDGMTYEGVLNLTSGLTAMLKSDTANRESRDKAERVRDSYPKRYADARNGLKIKILLPSWLKWVAYDKPYEFVEPQRTIVRDIFDRASKGYSYALIARDLNQRGVKPFRTGRKKTQGEHVWTTRSVLALVRSRFAIGEFQPKDGGPVIPDYFPSVLDDVDTYHRAQGARAERKRDGVTVVTAKVNVWSKIGICPMCQRFRYCVPKGRHGEHYLICKGKIAGVCTATNVPAARSELAFLEILLNVVNADLFLSDQSNEQAELQVLEGQIDAAETQRQKLSKALLVVDDVEEIGAALRIVKADLERLRKQQQEKQQKLQERTEVERSRASILAQFDLQDRDSRLRANSLLRGLGIVVEISKQGRGAHYTVRQGPERKRVLEVYDDGTKPPQAVAYSEDTAKNGYYLGDTVWPEKSIDKPWGQGKRKKEGQEPTSAEPVPDWSQYEEYTYVQSDTDFHDDEYTPKPEE